MYRALILLFGIILLFYYITVILFGLGLLNLSTRRFEIGKAIRPFYYWIK